MREADQEQRPQSPQVGHEGAAAGALDARDLEREPETEEKREERVELAEEERPGHRKGRAVEGARPRDIESDAGRRDPGEHTHVGDENAEECEASQYVERKAAVTRWNRGEEGSVRACRALPTRSSLGRRRLPAVTHGAAR